MAQQYLEIVAKGTLAANGSNSVNIINVFHFRRTSTLDPISKANIESAFQAAVMDKVLLAASEDYGQDGTTLRFIDDALDAAALFSETGVGAIATDRAPGLDCVTMQLVTGIRGRFARGSKHFAGLVEAHTTGDIINGTGATLWNAVRDGIKNGFTDADGNVWVPFVNSHQPPAQWLVNPVVMVANDVTNVILNLTVGTMRRRKAKTVV